MRHRRLIKDEIGSAAVEFSLIAVPALLFIFGAIETSRFLWAYTALQETSAYAARCVGLRAEACSSDQVSVNIGSTRAFIIADAQTRGINLGNSVVTVTGNTACEGVNNFSRVTIEYPFENIFTIFENSNISVTACFPNQPN